MKLPNCPECKSEYTYEDGNMYVCPECAHQWSQFQDEINEEEKEESKVFRDANGNILENGDSVLIIEDLKVGGDVLKRGTKIDNITLLEVEVNGHDIDCRVPGFGNMYLKTSVIRKA